MAAIMKVRYTEIRGYKWSSNLSECCKSAHNLSPSRVAHFRGQSIVVFHFLHSAHTETATSMREKNAS